MKGDFTRSTFNSEKHYSSVRMQQGRLQLDADWNEQVDIQAHLNQVQVKDLIGLSGVPKSENNEQSFKIISAKKEDGYFTIAPGRIYVEGILCELEKESTYKSQPDYPNALQEDLGQEELQEGDYIAYLDVWQRHITSVDDPQIREVALGNVPDTATRTKTVWQVKLRQVNNIKADDNRDDFFQQQQDRDIALTPKVSNGANLENHLYRVEIHKGGTAREATFKWSRDNGFVVSAIEKIDGNIITIPPNKDESWQLARPRQWLEIIQIDRELAGKPGILVRLQRVSGNKLIIDLASIKEPSGLQLPDKFEKKDQPGSEFFKIRLWDYTIDTGEAGISVTADNNSGYISLEGEGIEVKFQGEGNYQTGDYWLIPSRTNRQNPLDWPTKEEDSSAYQDLPPDGIKHYYSPLAQINFTKNNLKVVEDLRKSFPSLINCLDGTDFTIGSLQVQGQIPETTGKGTIASNSENPDDVTVNYFGDGFSELGVGDSIVAQNQARTIQSLDSQRLRLTVNQPFNPVLEESEPGKGQQFSYQKPLVRFSYSSETTELIFNRLGLEVKGKIAAQELELPPQGTFETGTFKGQSLELGIRQNRDTFSTYGLIQAEDADNNKQISFTADSDVRFAFLKKQGNATPSQPLIVIDERLKVNGIVDATDFYQNGNPWILDTERISDDAITNPKLADDVVTAEKLRADASDDLQRAVTTDHIRDRAITTPKLADDVVTGDKLSANAVDTNHISDGAVTLAKLANSISSNLSKWSDGNNGNIFYNNGNVGIGTSAPTAKLHVDGSVRIDDDIFCRETLMQNSSRAFKTNIAELSIQEANQILESLNPIKFNYKKGKDSGGRN